MASSSIADAAKPFLDYLDKEMTIQGILSAFCVAVGAAAFDRVLGAKAQTASDLVIWLQVVSYPYVLAAIIGLMIAALFFYLQRSDLAWLHGQISLAVTRGMQDMETPADTNSFTDGLDIGNSWSLWNRYKFGLSFLAVTSVEVLLALSSAISKNALFSAPWLIAGMPFLLAIAIDLLILQLMSRRDDRAPGASKRRVRNIRMAHRNRRNSIR